jgi:hypothetical protein
MVPGLWAIGRGLSDFRPTSNLRRPSRFAARGSSISPKCEPSERFAGVAASLWRIGSRTVAGATMARIITTGATLALGLAFATPSPGQTLVSAENPGRLAEIIQRLGFQAKVDRDDIGDPVIYSSSSGFDFTIYFYDCKDNERCKSLHFTAGYDLAEGTTLEAVQQWNADKRFASSYLDDEADPFLQMDVNTEGGITEKNFEAWLDLWQSLKGEFETYIGARGKPQRVSSADRPTRGA